MTKIRAAGVHLLLSAIVVSVIFAIIFFVWYPAPTFQIAGALEIVFILIGVDLVLGPLLTLIVYKQGKKSLKFDLSVIALIQLSALIYGSYTLYLERPYYMVFAVDRFNIVSEQDIDKSSIRFDELQKKPVGDVIRVFARLPEGQAFQAFLDSVIVNGEPDLERRPEFWEPYENGKSQIAAKIRSLDELNIETPVDAARVQRVRQRHQDRYPKLGFVPVGSRKQDIGMVMDVETIEPIDVVKVNPWKNENSDESDAVGGKQDMGATE